MDDALAVIADIEQFDARSRRAAAHFTSKRPPVGLVSVVRPGRLEIA